MIFEDIINMCDDANQVSQVEYQPNPLNMLSQIFLSFDNKLHFT